MTEFMPSEFGLKDRWHVGERAFFQYECDRSHDSADTEVWYRSHQPVEIIDDSEELYDPAPDLDTLRKRVDEGQPRFYEARFSDGLKWAVCETELYIDPKFFDPEFGPPPVHEIEAARQARGLLPGPPQDAHQDHKCILAGKVIRQSERGYARGLQEGT